MSINFSPSLYEQFLRTGAFGTVHTDADESAVIETAGKVEDWATPDRSTRLIAFQSRHLQVALYRGKVALIGLYFRDKSRPAVALQHLDLSGHTSLEDFRRWMRLAGVAGTEQDLGSGTVHIKLPSGVNAVFDKGVLDSLQL